MGSHSVKMKVQPFTWKAYEFCLRTALDAGYRFLGFDSIQESSAMPGYPFILLRHDIDYDPNWALPISNIEADNQIRATYFFQVDSPFYKVDSAETTSIIEQILRQKHWLGVHFDANQIKDDAEVIERLERTASLFEARFSTNIAAASFHMPTYRPVKHLNLKNHRINTYSPLFFEQIHYFSDSNQDWRGNDIIRTLQQKELTRIQLLVHPIWWRETYSPFHTKLEELAGRLNIPIESILTREQRDLLSRLKTD